MSSENMRKLPASGSAPPSFRAWTPVHTVRLVFESAPSDRGCHNSLRGMRTDGLDLNSGGTGSDEHGGPYPTTSTSLSSGDMREDHPDSPAGVEGC